MLRRAGDADAPAISALMAAAYGHYVERIGRPQPEALGVAVQDRAEALGESLSGRQSPSTFPLGATSAVASQSERNPHSSMRGKGASPTSPSIGAAPSR